WALPLLAARERNERMLRVNVGCGATPTAGWLNLDNSWTVRLVRVPLLWPALKAAGLLDSAQVAFGELARREGIRWADAAQHLPLGDGTVEAIYSSHMFEHLD